VSADHAELPVAVRAGRLEDQAVAAGLTTDAELDEILAGQYFAGSAAGGARIVARAWADPGFRERLLADGNAAAAELGLGAAGRDSSGYRLKAVENTARLHNLVVCTLCSCYPTALLGPSPGWYKSFAYRSRAVREPREVLAEFGLRLPAETEIVVWDSTAETRYLVVPARPAGTAGLSEDELAALVSRDGMIGTAPV
jgi:nitrile hydratase